MQFAAYFRPEWQPYLYLLWQRLQEGHICVPKIDLACDEIKNLFPGFDQDQVDEKEFISDGSVIRPVVEINGNLYLHRYFHYETIIINRIKELIGESGRDPGQTDGFKMFFNRSEDKDVDWQQVAAAACLINNFTIITGGPGTGKTTTVASILGLLLKKNSHSKVALAAPTGKAAARMAESLNERAENFSDELKELFAGIKPSTIHRLLGSRKDSIHFKHNRDNPLNYDIIIVDESSMIDVALFAKLLDAVAPDTKLILLGDKNQLSSVEAGSLFGDLCGVPAQLNVLSKEMVEKVENITGKQNGIYITDRPSVLSDFVIELQKSYRFVAEKGIGKLSRIVISEDVEGLKEFINERDDVVDMDPEYSNKMFEDFAMKFRSYIGEENIAIALEKLNECRVLCATREGKYGVYETNRRIERILGRERLIRYDRLFYEHRPIMITKNNYQLGLYNGDIGIVRKGEDGSLKVWFNMNGELKPFDPSLISREDTAFALTIHKSQGSEFKEILVLLPDHDVQVLTKELIYTAITRAKEHVLIQANKNVLINSVTRSVKRGSGLIERFSKAS